MQVFGAMGAFRPKETLGPYVRKSSSHKSFEGTRGIEAHRAAESPRGLRDL